MYGAIDNPDLAKKLARRRRWGPDPTFRFLEPEELQVEYAQQLQEIRKGQWLAGVSPIEGELPSHLELIETTHVDDGMFVNKDLVDKLKRYFMERDGVKVSDILSPPRQGTAPEMSSENTATVGEDKPPKSQDIPLPTGEDVSVADIDNARIRRLKRRGVEDI
jgi:hypothetical protein